jgi:hypothetical protein
MPKISVCKKCNRVQVDEEGWSDRPSTRVKIDSPNITPVDDCGQCGKDIPEEPKPKKNGTAKKKEPEQIPVLVESTPMEEKEKLNLPKKTLSQSKEYAKQAHENHQNLQLAKSLMGQALLKFAELLRESYEQEYYKAYSDSWDQYLSTPEISMDSSRARRLIRLSKIRDALEAQTGKPVELEDIAEYRLTRHLLPCVDFDEESGKIKNLDEVHELIEKARSLGHEDFEAEVGDHKTKSVQGGLMEKRIQEGNIKDVDGNIIGKITSVYANEKNHYVKLRIDNAYIPDGKLTVIIE